MNKIKLGSILAAILIFKGSAVMAATTSINLHNNKDNTMTVKVPNIQKDIYGIQLELTTKEALTKDVAFEPTDENAYSFTVRDGNQLKIYITSNEILDLGQDADLGHLVDVQHDQFLNTASYRVVDYFYASKDTLNVDVEYTEENSGSDGPEIETPNNPAEPNKPISPSNPAKPNRPGSSTESDKPSSPSKPSSPDDSSKPEDSEKPSTPSIAFTDTKAHWASKSIQRMAELGIIKGYGDGTFRPNQSITKAEFSAIVVRAFGFESTSDQIPFKDVVPGKWYTSSVLALYENGIVGGRPDGTLGVNDTINNQEIATIIARIRKTLALKLDVEKDYVAFKDEAAISPFAKEAVKELYEVGIIGGAPDGTFNPKGSVTRAQVAAMIDRFLLKVETK